MVKGVADCCLPDLARGCELRPSVFDRLAGGNWTVSTSILVQVKPRGTCDVSAPTRSVRSRVARRACGSVFSSERALLSTSSKMTFACSITQRAPATPSWSGALAHTVNHSPGASVKRTSRTSPSLFRSVRWSNPGTRPLLDVCGWKRWRWFCGPPTGLNLGLPGTKRPRTSEYPTRDLTVFKKPHVQESKQRGLARAFGPDEAHDHRLTSTSQDR